MKRSLFVTVGLLAAAGAVAPASAQTPPSPVLRFENVCAQRSATFRVCASAEVFITSGNVLNFKVWNMNGHGQSAYAPASTAEAYADQYGGWHTITSVGISNLGYAVGNGANLSTAIYHSNGETRVLERWGTDASANSLQIAHTGADLDSGHREGIVGCFDPDRTGNQGHVQTCNSFPGEAYVLFQISGFTSLTLDGAAFEFHGQQVAANNCNINNFNGNCTSESLKGLGTSSITLDPELEHVVPEPITMVLLGSGLLGLGAARARRRRLDGQDAA
jgi:hypothetical protein